MTRKPDLPSLDSELAPARRRLDLRAIQPQPVADDAQVAANSEALGAEWGAQTSLNPADRRIPLASLRIVIPEYLDTELAMKAAQQRVTKQYLVLQALKAGGYQVAEADLVPDKRKLRR
jgi:hypothetical protein